jgi:hypothetical protein
MSLSDRVDSCFFNSAAGSRSQSTNEAEASIMIRISLRIWAGVLALFLLPVFAFASDNKSDGNNSGATGTSESTSASATAPSAAPAAGIAAPGDPLLRLMVSQGLLSPDDVKKLAGVPSAELRDRLLMILLMKNRNSLSADDLNALKAPATTAVETSVAAKSANAASEEEQATGPPQPPQTPPPSGPIPAVAPVRVLAIDPPKREGVLPVVNIGRNVRIQPYGFFKASAVYDTSSPYGNDFPLPGFNPITNGPNTLPEFHVKARFARFGGNFEWLDTPQLILTARVEGDWEGNFSRVNNRNISTIRSNMFQLRLAYARIDYKPSDTNSVFALFGQDWTPFSSSTLPNLFETTGLGVGFGTLYERDPQFRFGMEHNFGSFKLGPEAAIVLPSYGNLPADLTVQSGPLAGTPIPNSEGIGNQLGYGERQGVDSGRPEFQARLVGQFQLDHAPGVAPAQIIVSGVHGSRRVNILANQVPAAFAAAFPSGADLWTDRNAWTGEIQLPTRFFTLVGKYYNGSDLRFYFGGQIFSEFNDTTGLTGTATAQSQDGASTVVFGLRNGVRVLAAQRPPRAQGGFLNLGIPLSRLANANPAGRNAGWVVYFHYGYDQVLARDVRRLGGGREKGDLAAGTLQYKLNNFVTFVVEESLYRTRALPLTATGLFPAFDGRPMREWKDFRSEIGPLFTF